MDSTGRVVGERVALPALLEVLHAVAGDAGVDDRRVVAALTQRGRDDVDVAAAEAARVGQPMAVGDAVADADDRPAHRCSSLS
jgi:hypothetical protein